MKTILFVLVISTITIAQTKSLNIRGAEIEIGMNEKVVWDLIPYDLNILRDDDGNMIIADKSEATIGIIYFKNEKVYKVAKDSGTAYKTNVGQVFMTLSNILKQYGEELNNVKILPMESFTAKGEQNSIRFYINDYRYIDIKIQYNVSIFEVIEEPGI
jgi:hypothetical protein